MKTIHIELDRAEGSLQRLIGLIERRGFHIDGMAMAGAGEHRTVSIEVRPRDAGRHVDVLGRQIDRMFGARRVNREEAVSCVA
ncbi:MAG TPA: ACT domain-containing protein [Rhizomicrobium sp.]|nr:ACT domain-containing protein [Rhizomicrobium sp.]